MDRPKPLTANVGQDAAYLGMRVNLIGENGHIDALLLPRVAEGKYRFSQAGSGFLSIEALGGQWYLCCDAATCFVGAQSVDCRQTPLALRQMYFLRNAGRQYILYAETITKASSVFRNYRARYNVPIRFGRDNTNDIVSSNGFVSHHHAIFRLTERGWEVQDLESANGVYVNHCRVRGTAALKLGDVVYLMGPRVIVGTDFLSICSGDTKMYVSPSVLPVLDPPRSDVGVATGARRGGLYNRGPRSRYSMEWPAIAVDAPPMPMNSDKMPLVLRMGSSAVMGGRSIMMGSYSMALTSLVFPFLTQRYTEKERKEYEARRLEKYGEYLEAKKQEIEKECKHEYDVLNANYPNMSSVLGYFESMVSRLWERRNTDDDFLTLRIGSGTVPMRAALEYPQERFEMEQDTLEAQMYALVQQTYVIPKAPVMTSLLEDYVCGVVGDRPYVLAFVRSLAAQLMMTHSYDEVKCIFLLEKEELPALNEVRYLPHVWNNERTIRFLATSQPGASAIGEYLRREMEGAFGAKADVAKYRRTHPHYVVFALSKSLYDNLEVLKDVLAEDHNVGLSVVAAFEQQPKESTRIFRMSSTGTHHAYDLLHPDQPPQEFALDRYGEDRYLASMKKLANTSLMTIAGSYSLPKTFTFLEMFGVGKVEHLNLLKRWADSDPTRSLAAPVGVGTDGELFMLDLHEKRQGPHGLVAGMTGSGKSEFIITYILSMAVNFSPDEVAFLLIDYKGGGLAGAFEDKARGIHLPHLVGTITNLDGAAISRSMISIESELKRRQRIFNEAKSRCNEGTLDIYDYQRLYRAHRVEEPLPHLFIISDEFAELKSQQPEFMDKLISTARIGRSLGVHLILATQKPSGVVNDQIWSNTKFRVCLRVQDTGDSQDMLKRPDAASLKDTGRFYLQVGYNEYFAMGQSAWCGAEYIPQDEVVQQKDESVQVIDDTAQTLLVAKPIKKKKKAESKQIVAVVQYLSEMAKREHIIPRTLLPPPLPTMLTLAQLQERFPGKTPEKISALVGMIDDPGKQEQYPMELDLQSTHNLLLVGESGCGKTAMIQTMLLNLAQRYTPEQVNFYILDFSSKLLTQFRRIPHCGIVLTDEDEPSIDRLFEMITDETKRRQKLFAQAEVNSYEAYCRVEKLPLWVVVIDGVVNFTSIKKGNFYYSTIHDFMRDGAPYGIKFVLAGGHYNEFSMRVRQEASEHIGMNQKDKYGYFDILGGKTEYLPPCLPGRGLCIWEEQPLEFQGAILSDSEDQQAAAQQLRAALDEIAARDAAYPPAMRLPMVEEGQSYAEFCEKFAPMRIPLGYNLSDAKPVALPLRQTFSLTVYNGNPAGAEHIVSTLLQAYCREHMELFIVRRNFNSIYADGSDLLQQLQAQTKVTLFEQDKETGLQELFERLMAIMGERMQLRNEFVQQNGLTRGDPQNTVRAFEYIHAHSTPLMVIFENYYEFAKSLYDGQAVMFAELFRAQDPNTTSKKNNGYGYNIYYTACFGPGEYTLTAAQTPMADCFNPQKFTLMFGGQLDKCGAVPLPRDYLAINEPDEHYNHCVMYYQGRLAGLSLPCGELVHVEPDPDEVPII